MTHAITTLNDAELDAVCGGWGGFNLFSGNSSSQSISQSLVSSITASMAASAATFTVQQLASQTAVVGSIAV